MPDLVREDDERALEVAARALRGGGTVLLPTDTVYGVAALAADSGAVDELYRLKGRPESVPIAVLVESFAQASVLVASPAAAVERLVAAFWPGPLTVVLARSDGAGTVGVRCPDRPFVRALARLVGPLAVTSANRHGEPTPSTAMDAAAALADDVSVVIDGGSCPGTASTVVDGTDAELRVLRAGPITHEELMRAALR